MEWYDLINHNKVDWDKMKVKYPLGQKLECRVLSHRPFGVFLDIGDKEVLGLVAVIDFDKEDVYPPVESLVTGVIIGYTEDTRNQIWISINPKVISGHKLPFGY
jgi:ribosomal protein S1